MCGCGIPGKVVVNRVYWFLWAVSLTWFLQLLQTWLVCPALAYVTAINHREAIGGFAVGYAIQWIFLNAVTASAKYKDVICIIYVSLLCWVLGQAYGTLTLIISKSYRTSLYEQFPWMAKTNLRTPTHAMLVGLLFGLLVIFPTLAVIYPQWSSPIPQHIPGAVLFIPWIMVGAIAGHTGMVEVRPMKIVNPTPDDVDDIQHGDVEFESVGDDPHEKL